MIWPPEWLPREPNGRVARWRLTNLGAKSIEDFLTKSPIRANRIEQGPTREAMKKRETDARVEALFALYNIPEDWDELLQWRQLALCLAGRSFAGCRTLDKGLGGPGTDAIERQDKLKIEILAHFTALQKARPDLSAIGVASVILKTKKHKQLCADAKIATAKSLAQAMARIRRKTGTETAP